MTQVKLTETARDYIKQAILKQQGTGLRVSVKKTGCSGYSYVPSVVNTAAANDTVVDMEGVMVYLDTAWLHLLDGIEIDFIEDEKTGLKQKRLVFNNANEAGRCGCGESFHIE